MYNDEDFGLDGEEMSNDTVDIARIVSVIIVDVCLDLVPFNQWSLDT